VQKGKGWLGRRKREVTEKGIFEAAVFKGKWPRDTSSENENEVNEKQFLAQSKKQI
jgi:hypothetical protein